MIKNNMEKINKVDRMAETHAIPDKKTSGGGT